MDGYHVAGAVLAADFVLGLSVNRWMLAPIDRPQYSAVFDYYERLSERPGFLAFGRTGEP